MAESIIPEGAGGSTNSAAPESMSAVSGTLSQNPVYTYMGRRRSKAFSEGVAACKERLIRILSEDAGWDFTQEERIDIELIGSWLAEDLQAPKDKREGYIAALADYFAVSRHSTMCPEHWTPLFTYPVDVTIGNVSAIVPASGYRLFDVDGKAVGVSEELYCVEFRMDDPGSYKDFDLDAVRERGREISREEFDKLRWCDRPHKQVADEQDGRSAQDGV